MKCCLAIVGTTSFYREKNKKRKKWDKNKWIHHIEVDIGKECASILILNIIQNHYFDVLLNHGKHCCLIGSVAWGNRRF